MKFSLPFLFVLILSSALFSQNTGNATYDNAFRNYTSGNFSEAINYYNEYLKSNTNNDKALYERGMCYESLRRFDDALNDYNEAIRLKPLNSSYYISRGYVLVKKGMPQNAYDDFTKAIQNSPRNADGYFGRVNAYMDLNKFDLAISDLNMAINLTPDNSLLYYVRAFIYVAINDTAKFYNDIQKILDVYPSAFFSNYKSQGVVLILDNLENDAASMTYEIKYAPNNFLLYFRRGFDYFLLRKFDAAIEDFTVTIKLLPAVESKLSIYSSLLIENCIKFK